MSLKMLQLVGCNLKADCVATLASIAKEAQSIKSLALDYNPISDGIYEIMDAASKNINGKLQALSLRYCSVTDSGLQRMETSISNMRNLMYAQ